MSGRLLLLCPGQGGQHPAMFDLARTSTRASALLDTCGLPDPGAAMFDNRVAQPLIVGATLAMWEALKDIAPAPSLVAGYSIGELSAHGVAGALGAAAAVALAKARADAMDAAAMAMPPQAMVAISGLPVERVRVLVRHEQFNIAIVTGEDSCIAGGLAGGAPALERAVVALGGRFQLLPVSVASHTPLMAGAVEPFARTLRAAEFGVHACPVLSGISAVRVSSKEAAIEHLSRQLAEPVQWSGCMDAAAEAGITVALELGPGAALSRMLQARHPGIACRSVADFRSIDGIAAWLGRQFD